MIGDDDLSIFENDFGVDAVFTITPALISPPTPAVTLTVKGVFNEPSQGVNLGAGFEVEAVQPSITCQTLEIAAVRPKMKCTVGAVVYQVERIANVGVGLSDVWLKTSN